ncbi:MAG: glycoside hydrolase family 13 protein [Tessaracoccus sp.]
MPSQFKPKWWENAVFYQVYPRSFADSNGDGIGDIPGIRQHLPYLKKLGVDAIWVNPWYPSPQVDAGYDVADYRDIDPLFGTLDDAQALIDDAHALGLRVVVDIVPNHTSDQHPWFQEALKTGPGSRERDRYWFRPGRGKEGELPPNNWCSTMGTGTNAWTRVTEPDGNPGEWYLHLFSAEQPDLNWDSREVRDEFLDVLRFWFDRGADGFRIDVAMALAKDPGLPNYAVNPDGSLNFAVGSMETHPHFDRDEVQDIYREWRAVADEYPGDRFFVAEAWVLDTERYRRYLAPGVLQTSFNFGFLMQPWECEKIREAIDKSLKDHEPLEAPPTWVLSNHDTTRHLSRYGHREALSDGPIQNFETPLDLELGTSRARAAAFLTLALPGGAYVYQGEELGLWEVEDLPDEVRQDPVWFRSGGKEKGRDGCRVPLPWEGTEPPFGFSPANANAAPWLPQPDIWRNYAVEHQLRDDQSMLRLYEKLLHIRTENQAWTGTEFEWLPSPDGVLTFRRGSLVCAVNFSDEPASVVHEGRLLAASHSYDGQELPPNSAVWLSHS